MNRDYTELEIEHGMPERDQQRRQIVERLARGKAMHYAVTGVPEAWDEIGEDGREDWCETADRYAALLSPPEATEQREPDALISKLLQVAAHVCWECRAVTFTEDLWATGGCPECGAHGYAIPLVWRPPAQRASEEPMCGERGVRRVGDTDSEPSDYELLHDLQRWKQWVISIHPELDTQPPTDFEATHEGSDPGPENWDEFYNRQGEQI